MSLPMIPGYGQQHNKMRQGGFGKAQALTFRNGVPDLDPPDERVKEVTVDPGVPVPAEWRHENKALKISGYFVERLAVAGGSGGGFAQHENEDGSRVRRCTLSYHLVDGTMNVNEPRIQNSGIPQGTLVRRQRVPKSPGSTTEFFGLVDLKLGATLHIFGKALTLTSMDRDSQNMMVQLGIMTREEAGEVYPTPGDRFEEMRTVLDTKTVNRKAAQDREPDTLRSFLENDRVVLRFYCAWDDTDQSYGDLRKFKMHVFLTDYSVELIEMHAPNSGFDRFATFMSRQKVAGFPDVVELAMGAFIEIYGRKFQLYDCDEQTRAILRKSGVSSVDPYKLPSERMASAPPPSRPIPSHEQGLREGTLTSLPIGENDLDTDDPDKMYKGLIPKPPKQNFAKLLDNEGRIMRFAGKIVSTRPEDQERQFVVGFYLADDTVGIFEPPQRNTGIQGGKFLQRRKVKNPDTGLNYTAKDFVIGARIHANSHTFVLHSADEYALNWMESKPGEFPQSDIATVQDILKQQLAGMGGDLSELRALFEQCDADGNGFVTPEEFRDATLSFGFEVTEQEIVTMIRRFDMDGDGRISYDEFQTIFA